MEKRAIISVKSTSNLDPNEVIINVAVPAMKASKTGFKSFKLLNIFPPIIEYSTY